MIAPLTLWLVLIDMSGRFSERMHPDVVTKLWDLREDGRTGEEIAVLLGWKKTAVFNHIQDHDGVRPRWGRNLKGRSLSFEAPPATQVEGVWGH